jgi:hypothetical protein
MRRALLAALAVLTLAAPAAVAQTATSGSPQALFTRLIRDDEDTLPSIRAALESGRAIVDPDVTFAELTGDNKQDAIVRVDGGGAGGAVAVYVFSSDGAKRVRAVYRTQRLYRALIRVEAATLLIRTPRYRRRDELCCPRSMFERRLTWSEEAERMVLRSTRVYPRVM